MASPASDDAAAAAAFDFLEDYLDDVAQGRERPLAAYLARWPGHEDAVAAEYLRQRAARAGEGPQGDGSPGDPDPDVEPDTDAGRRVGPYRLVRELGSGGQGAVWLAEDTRIARRVALKLLPGLFVTAERRARLRREAESVSRLAHPGICATLEAEVEGETPYIALQHVPGQTVAASLAAVLEAGDGPRVEPLVPWLPRDRTELARVLHFFERAARALHAAHEAGLVHRDIKPGNVMVTPEGAPVLLDFGLARDAEPGDETLTRSGEVFGTPAYMSPEQLRGEELDRRTDVYSLGVTLFEALTGARPFERGSRFALEQAVLLEPLPDPRAANPALTEDVRAVLETAADKDAARRYPTALALAEDLRRIREFEPVRARPATRTLRLRRWARRQPALAAALTASFLTLAGGLTVSLALLAQKTAALSRSYGKQFTRRSAELAASNPSVALALGIDAAERVGDHQSRSVLFAALEACHLERALDIRPEEHFGARIYDLAVGAGGTVVAVSNLAEPGPEGLPRPAGGLLATWDLESGRRALLHRLDDVPRCVALHPSGRVAAVGTDAGRVLAVELEGGRELFALGPGAAEAEGQRTVRDLAFSPDGASLLVQLATSGTLRVRFPDGSVIARFASAPGSGRVRLSPDGAHVLTAGDPAWGAPALPSAVELWTPRGTRVATLEHPGPVQDAAWTADGRVVTACGRSLRLWSVEGALLEEGAAPDPVTCLAPAPDGRVAVTTTRAPSFRSAEWSGDEPGLVSLWTPGGPWRELGRHDGPAVHATWSPDGETLASTGWDLAVRVWEPGTGRLVKTCRETFRPLVTRWSADGSRLVTMTLGWRAYVWGARPMPYLYRLVGHGGPVRWAAFAPDGSRAWTAGEDGTLRAFATPAGDTPAARQRSGAPLARWPVHEGPVHLASLSSDGTRALTVGELDGTARVTDLESGAPLARVELATDGLDAGLAPDGRAGFVLESGGELVLFDVEGGSEARVAVAAQRAVLSPDGARLATLEERGRVHLRDPRDGGVVAVWEHSKDEATDLAWGPHGELAVVATAEAERHRPWLFVFGPDGELRVERRLQGTRVAWSPRGRAVLGWDELYGNRIALVDLERPGAAPLRPGGDASQVGVTAVAFSADGAWVACASRDGSVLVWSTADGAPLAHHTTQGAGVNAVAFAPAPGDLRVVSAGEDGTAMVWPADPLPAARARQPRPLDELEERMEWRLATGRR